MAMKSFADVGDAQFLGVAIAVVVIVMTVKNHNQNKLEISLFSAGKRDFCLGFL